MIIDCLIIDQLWREYKSQLNTIRNQKSFNDLIIINDETMSCLISYS